MKNFQHKDFRLGIIGGGQLGRMLIQAGIDLNINFSIVDPDENAPCRSLVDDFTLGSFKDYDTVIEFGKKCDLLTIEIEHINIDALFELEKMGKTIYPSPSLLKIVQDKGIQKQFYKDNGIPTSDFVIVDCKLPENTKFPIVHKLRKDGYDGKGVNVLKSESDFETSFKEPSLLEAFVPFEKEIAVIVARNPKGEINTFPVVEMVFHPTANLVEYLFSPAQIDTESEQKADKIARKVADKINLVGILAVEMFLTKEGDILVNEIAPRPHNSGHQTIEGNITSQYQQHLRAILDLPLGDTSTIMPSAMVNILGADGHTGNAKPQGLEEVMALEGVYPHFYGKKLTKPFRKMGHCTILDKSMEGLKEKVEFVKEKLTVVTE